MKTAILFSGQGAQYPGMMLDIADAFKEAGDLFALADSALNRSFYDFIAHSDQETLNQTRNTQPCMLVCELAALRVLQSMGLPYDAVCGFSLGEWAAVVACGALGEADALQMIVRRADAMQRSVPEGMGAMAYILGQSDEFVEAYCKELGDVAPANYNGQGNISVAGTAEAIDRFLTKGEQDGYMVGRIPVSIPSHCWLMEPAARELEPYVYDLEMCAPTKQLYMNATGKTASDVGEIKNNLIRQLTSPVLFRQTVDALLQEGFDTFIEVGPGKTLSKMVKKAAKQKKAGVQILQANSVEHMRELQSLLP